MSAVASVREFVLRVFTGKKDGDIFDPNEVYTPLSEVEAELERRRNDAELQKRVADFFGEDFFEHLEMAPRAVFNRTIISPNLELFFLLDVLEEISLDPLFLEFDSKFVARNNDKYHLCKMYFIESFNKNGKPILSTKRLVDFNTFEGNNFSEIQTLDGENVTAYHNNLLRKLHPDLADNIVDFSDWFYRTREKTDFYYLYFLSLFVCHGVLFENFLFADKEERDFFKEKIHPSLKEIERLFGVKPLICPVLPLGSEHAPTWAMYNSKIKEIVG